MQPGIPIRILSLVTQVLLHRGVLCFGVHFPDLVPPYLIVRLPHHVSGKWLRDAWFDTGTGVTVKISEGCLIMIAESNEGQELRKEFYYFKQVVKGVKSGISGVLCEV